MRKTFTSSVNDTYTVCSVMPDAFVMTNKIRGKDHCSAHEFSTQYWIDVGFPPGISCSNCEFYLGTEDEG